MTATGSALVVVEPPSPVADSAAVLSVSSALDSPPPALNRRIAITTAAITRITPIVAEFCGVAGVRDWRERDSFAIRKLLGVARRGCSTCRQP